MKDIIIYRICPQCECRTHISSLTVTTGLGEKVTNKQCFFYPLTSVSCQWALSSSPVSVGPQFQPCQWALGSQPCVSGPSVPSPVSVGPRFPALSVGPRFPALCQWTLSSSPVSGPSVPALCQWPLGSQPCQWALSSSPVSGPSVPSPVSVGPRFPDLCQWTLSPSPVSLSVDPQFQPCVSGPSVPALSVGPWFPALCQWTLSSSPVSVDPRFQPCQWALGSQPCQWALSSSPVSGPSVPSPVSVGPRFPALCQWTLSPSPVSLSVDPQSQPCVSGPSVPALSVGPWFPALCQWALSSSPVSGPSVPSPVSLQRVSEALEQHSFCGVHAGLSWVRVEQLEWMVLIKEVGSELEGCMEGSGQVEVQARPGMPSLPPPPPTPLETPHFTSLTSHDLSALTEMLDHDFLRFCSEGCVTLLVTGWSEVHGNMNFKY